MYVFDQFASKLTRLSNLPKLCEFILPEDSPYRDIHCAGYGDDKNSVKGCDQVFLAGEGGQEEAEEGDAAEVGDGQGEQAEQNLPYCHLISSSSLFLIIGSFYF